MLHKKKPGRRLAKEKVRQWKKALREYDSITEHDVVGPEEMQSIALLETLDAQQAGLQVCTLGSRILRCETAPLCALSAVMYATGGF